MNAQFMGHLANRGRPLGVLLVVAVGEIQPEGGGTGENQGTDLLR